MFETLLIRNFLDPSAAQRIVEQLRTAPAAAAPVYGARARVDENVRHALLPSVSEETTASIVRLLDDAMPEIARRFSVALASCEPPQFVRYPRGGFFVAHQDGNTSLIRDDSNARRVSVVIFLNESSEEQKEGTYGGGSLMLHGSYPHFDERYRVPAEPGSLVAFRSETTHEVTPVTHGERYTIVSWYRQ